jgi:hypothetical protein
MEGRVSDDLEKLLSVYRNRVESTILWRLTLRESSGSKYISAAQKLHDAEAEEMQARQAIADYHREAIECERMYKARIDHEVY